MLAQVSSLNSICSQSDKPCRFMSLFSHMDHDSMHTATARCQPFAAQLLAYSLQKNDDEYG